MDNQKLINWYRKAQLLGIDKYCEINLDTSTLDWINDPAIIDVGLPPVENIGIELGRIIDTYSTEKDIAKILPKTLKNLGVAVFRDCQSLVDIKIPDGLETIGVHAFNGCQNLKRVEIPSSVRKIDGGAFYNCKSLEEVIINNTDIEISGTAFDRTPWLKSKLNKEDTFIMGNTLIRAKNKKCITIPDNITKLAESCFRNNRSLVSISIPPGIKEIPNSCFRSCANLSQVKITSDIEDIGACAFYKCKTLETFVVPPKVETLRVKVFSDCTNLKQIRFAGDLKVIEPLALDHVNITELRLPKSVEYIFTNSITVNLHACKLEMYRGTKIFKGSILFDDNSRISYSNSYYGFMDDSDEEYSDGDYEIRKHGEAQDLYEHIFSGIMAPDIEYYE